MRKQIYITITKKHFKKAIAKPWDTCSCLVAQAIEDTVKEEVTSCGAESAMTKSFMIFFIDQFHITLLQQDFDNGHGGKQVKEKLASAKAALPFTFLAEVVLNQTED